jgi:hypothetical protein
MKCGLAAEGAVQSVGDRRQLPASFGSGCGGLKNRREELARDIYNFSTGENHWMPLYAGVKVDERLQWRP